MKTYILVFDSFCQFEVALAAYLLRTKGEVIALGLDELPAMAAEGLAVLPAAMVDRVDPRTIDLLILPGGETAALRENTELLDLIRAVHGAGGVIGAICGGVSVLRAAGIAPEAALARLDDPEADNVAVCGRFVTAKPNGYADFALELGRRMDIYEDEADYVQTVDFFKHFKSV